MKGQTKVMSNYSLLCCAKPHHQISFCDHYTVVSFLLAPTHHHRVASKAFHQTHYGTNIRISLAASGGGEVEQHRAAGGFEDKNSTYGGTAAAPGAVLAAPEYKMAAGVGQHSIFISHQPCYCIS
jgi:hypothetical protein